MKRTKRVLAFLLAVMMCLTALPVGIFAGTESSKLIIEASEVSGKPGETVDVPICITENPGVIAFGIRIRYDESVLTLKAMPEVTSLIGGSTQYSRYTTDNPFVAFFENSTAEENSTATGTLMVLQFEINESAAAGESAVEISFTDSGMPKNHAMQDVSCAVKSGAVIVDENPSQDLCFTVSDAQAKAGEQVELTVDLSNNPGIIAAELEIDYDHEAMELVGANDASLLGGFTASESYGHKPYYVSWLQNETNANNGKLLTLTFAVKSDCAPGEYPVTLKVKSVQNTDLELVTAKTVSGLVNVQAACFTVSEAVGYAGDQVQVTVSVDNNPGIVAAELELDFDRDVLELAGVSDAGLFGGLTTSESYADQPYYLSWLQNEPVSENGVLANLTFLVKEGSPAGIYPVDLTIKSVQNTNLEMVTAEAVSGSVTVPAAVFSLSEEIGYPGDTVDLTVEIANNPGVVSAELEIDFDHDALELVSVADSGLLDGYTSSENYTNQPYYLSWLQNEPVSEDGTLATLTFRIKDNCAYDTYPVTLTVKSAQNTDMESVGAEAVSGTVTVVENEAIAPRITVSEETAHIGGQVDVTVAISNNPGIVSTELEIDYDREILELIGAKDTGLLGGYTTSEYLTDEPFYISWLQNDPTAENGTLLTLTFQVKADRTVGDSSVVSVRVKSALDTDLDTVAFKTTNGSVTIQEHVWKAATYTWNEDNTVCTAERTCTCGVKETENSVVTKTVTEATCTEAGYIVYTAVFTNPVFDKQEKTVAGDPAKGHSWSEPIYTWNEDHTACTAERTCDCGAKETESGTVTNKTTEDGSTVYTAIFTNPAFAKQEKTVPGEPAHEHSWSKATYIWSRDYTTCMALRTCSCGEKETETVTVTKVVTDATCTEAGSVVYTAVFTNSAFATQEKRVAGDPAKGHSWSEPIYTWNEDHTACTAERICACGEKKTETAVVTRVTTEPTCSDAGKIVCTADFTKVGFADQTVEIVLDALGHDYQEIRDEDGKLVCKCSICGEEDPDFDAGEEDSKGENNKKTVTFRLIGDFVHEDGIDDHEEYVTWIETTTYTIKEGDTVYDVFAEALKDAGMKSKGAADGYVSAIRAPSVLGGYWLTELDNGPNAGWMYTVNGDHVSETLTEYELEDGDEILWHYVDDYTKEENPKSKYYERWLEADDISPETYVKRRLKEIVDIEGEGEVEPVPKASHIGEDVKFTFVPAEGWVIQSVTIDGKDRGAIDSYTYKNLSLNSRIEVVFVKEEEVVPTVWFIDVAETDWFYEDVYFTVNNGLFNGVSELYFEPATAMTRGMLVTVLYRMEGAPAVTGGSAFIDVAAGQWYTDAVIWATRNGVVNGYGDGRFGPNDPITREQMAAILFRYARNKGYDVTGRADLTAYVDSSTISGYAVDAMAWANANDLIQGRTITTLVPGSTATRAEVAAILHRFLLNIVK